jgi:ribosomal protein S1
MPKNKDGLKRKDKRESKDGLDKGEDGLKRPREDGSEEGKESNELKRPKESLTEFPRSSNLLSALEQRQINQMAYKAVSARIAPMPKTAASVMGVVAKIDQMSIQVALNNHQQGTLSITEISSHFVDLVSRIVNDNSDDPLPLLTDYFVVGQPIACAIINSSNLELSALPVRLNSNLEQSSLVKHMTVSVEITSVQDHGYICSFGKSDFHGFLPKIDTFVPEKELLVGQVLLCTVVANSNIISLSQKAFPPISDSFIEFDHIISGMLVSCRVSKVLENGLKLSVLDCFDASIDLINSGNASNLAKFKEDQNLIARVVFVDAEKRLYGLSLLPHFVNLTTCNLPQITSGTLCKVKVINVLHNFGLIVDCLVDEKLPQTGFIHVSPFYADFKD